jgi:hypothetical protein
MNDRDWLWIAIPLLAFLIVGGLALLKILLLLGELFAPY